MASRETGTVAEHYLSRCPYATDFQACFTADGKPAVSYRCSLEASGDPCMCQAIHQAARDFRAREDRGGFSSNTPPAH